MSATSCGRDMKGEWLDDTVWTEAFIRFANISCAGGGIIWSSVQTRYQDGSVFQATDFSAPVKLFTLNGL